MSRLVNNQQPKALRSHVMSWLREAQRLLMCKPRDFIVLAESHNAQVSWCKECTCFSLTYKCFCASFSLTELNGFGQILSGLHETDFRYEFMGRAHALVRNPHLQMGLCITRQDARDVSQLLRQAATMYDLFRIVYN